MNKRYEAQAGEIRKNISIAKAEKEKVRANRKLTRKAKENRVKLLKSCKSLSVAHLVDYMEKENQTCVNFGEAFGVKRGYKEQESLTRNFM